MYIRIRNHFAIIPIFAFSMSIVCGSALAGGLLAVEFDPGKFTNSTMIDNPYWPLLPGNTGRTFTYVGEADDECAINEISVTPGDHKSFANMPYSLVTAQVVLDRAWVVELAENEDCDADTATSNDDLDELTYDWYAQDMYQNIWYMGEASLDFGEPCPPLDGVDGVPLGAPRGDWPSDELFLECTGGSWEAGEPGQEEGVIIGEPGIVVPGDYPTGEKKIKPGTYYMQEVAEGAQDMAKIVRVDAPLSVEDGVLPGEYENCRKVKESNPFEPGASVEHKWYCTGGNGLVLIQGIGGGPTESEVLVRVTP